MDWQPHEDEMVLDAGKAGGEYLVELGVTDVRRLRRDQWLMFLRCIIGRLGEIRPAYRRRWEQLNHQEGGPL